ncbi:peptide-aspartate beta-dioxygenase [Aureococcus anophagefferens]|nr:peptide-aspartate beta-dioxygenase [Aureococcus anophagefferens]
MNMNAMRTTAMSEKTPPRADAKIGDLKAAVAKKLHAPPGDLALHTAAGACDDGAFLRDHVVDGGATAFVARRGASEPPPPPPPPQRRAGGARHRERGNAAFGRGDLDEAASCYELALVFDPRDAKSLANLASVALARKRAGDAAAYCARALCCGAAGDPLGKWWLRLARAQRLGRRFADEGVLYELAAAALKDCVDAGARGTAFGDVDSAEFDPESERSDDRRRRRRLPAGLGRRPRRPRTTSTPSSRRGPGCRGRSRSAPRGGGACGASRGPWAAPRPPSRRAARGPDGGVPSADAARAWTLGNVPLPLGGPQDRVFAGLEALIDAGDYDAAREAHDAAVRAGVWERPAQRPGTLVFGLRGRRRRRVVGTSTLNRVFKPYRSKALDRDALKRGAEWADFGLRFNGATNTRNCAVNRAPRPPVPVRAARADGAPQACPATSKILEDFSQAHTALHGSAYFSLLAPRTHIKRHCGPTNARLRLHLGLVVPDGCSIRVGDEVRTWVEGRCLLFDDSFEHEVWNDADEERLVLIVDVWHPDLKTDDQRKRHLEKELHGAYDHLKTARFWRDTTESGH